MYTQKLKKPDGRNLYLFSRSPIPDGIVAPEPLHASFKAEPHMRWHPLRHEWVIYAAHRQNRTFLPPKDYSPLNVTTNPKFPTEMPQGEYEVAVFENLFPSMNLITHNSPEMFVPTMPASGVCEVVVFTQKPEGSLGTLSTERIQLVLEVFANRTKELGEKKEIHYVLPFENKGVEMGVTLHHPHGQIYAYPFIPPVQKTMLKAMKDFYQAEGKNLLSEMIRDELKAKQRILFENKNVVVFIPVCARYPYETWIMPKRSVKYLYELTNDEYQDLAQALKNILKRFDLLWQRPFPYLMTILQAPFDQLEYPEFHMHIQIFPPYRTRDKLKYLAGTELGAGIFINDSLPEEKAKELNEVIYRED
ncbi:MAG: galactose-1-phosphate uridylyltransferase [Bacteriovoracaceae bacterium]